MRSVSWIWILALELVLATGVVAQEPAEHPTYASPREVMRGFLEGMVEYRSRGHAQHLEQAIGAFETDALSAAQAQALPVLVERLYDALNRVEYVRYEDLPAAGDPMLTNESYVASFGPPPSDPSARIHVFFVRTDGASWLISANTVAQIDTIWAGVADLPLIDDLPFLARIHYRIRAVLPASLLSRVFVLENWQWVGLTLLVFLAVIVDRIVRFVAASVLRRLARGEHVVLDAEAIGGFGKPLGLLFGAVFFGANLPVLDLQPGILSPLDLAASFVATIAGVWAAYRLVDVFCGILDEKASRTQNKFDDVLVPLIRRTLKIVVAIIGLVYLASKWTDDLWGVVAGLGVGSLAIAFAGRDTIENLFGTFTVLLDKPFELGDWIVVGDNEGTVEDVGFRSTRIRTFYNSLITVPNRTFITADVDNLGRRKYRRIKTMLSLTYDTPPEKVEAFCAGVRRIIATHPYTRKDYYHVYLNQFGASSLDILLYAFIECADWSTELRERHRLFADVLRLAEQLKIDFAFPTQTLHVVKPEDLEHPDRPENDAAGERIGREAADQIVEKTMRPFGGPGALPPPVVIDADQLGAR